METKEYAEYRDGDVVLQLKYPVTVKYARRDTKRKFERHTGLW